MIKKIAVKDIINDIIDTLGVLPNPADKVKVLVYVEGPHDISALIKYSEIFNGIMVGECDECIVDLVRELTKKHKYNFIFYYFVAFFIN